MSTSSNIPQEQPQEAPSADSMTCSICWGPPNEPVTTTCDHTFCKACLNTWFMSNMRQGAEVTCPICRAVLAMPIEQLVMPAMSGLPLSLAGLPNSVNVSINVGTLSYYNNVRSGEEEHNTTFNTRMLVFSSVLAVGAVVSMALVPLLSLRYIQRQ